MRTRTMSAPRTGAFARTGLVSKHDPEKCEAVFRKDHALLNVRTAARFEARLATMRCLGRMVRP